MGIEILDGKNIAIGMKNYIQEFIDLFYENVSTKVSPAENKDLHKLNQ